VMYEWKCFPLPNLQRISEIAKEDCLSGLTMNWNLQWVAIGQGQCLPYSLGVEHNYTLLYV
jgi:hypothetical protein